MTSFFRSSGGVRESGIRGSSNLPSPALEITSPTESPGSRESHRFRSVCTRDADSRSRCLADVARREPGPPIEWLGLYRASTPGVEVGDSATLRIDLDNEPQPDAFLRIEPSRGGQSRTTADGYVDGAPELVAEVAASSASYDLHAKLHVYRRSGVREYIVWRVLDGEIDWFALRSGQYQAMTPDAAGLLRSEAFPGLWLDPAALLRDDIARVLAVLQEGVRMGEHDAFVAQLVKAGAAT